MAESQEGRFVPSMTEFKCPAMFVKFLMDKIAAEPENPERLIYINYLATYLILLSEKKNFNSEIFVTINRVSPAIARLRVGSPIIPNGDEAWKARIIDDPFDAISHRPFLSFYFYYYFEEAKKSEGTKIPDYTGPVFGTI